MSSAASKGKGKKAIAKMTRSAGEKRPNLNKPAPQIAPFSYGFKGGKSAKADAKKGPVKSKPKTKGKSKASC